MLTGYEGLAYPQFVPPPGLYTQDPSEVLSYTIDWSDWLSTGDTISTSAWTADEGLTVAGGGNTTTTATVVVSGGVVRYLYRVKNTITTAGGNTGVRVLKIRILNAV